MKHVTLLLATLLAASPAFAQVSIDQNRALAGNITPGDAPGFPITLSQPGTYRLMSNLVVPANTTGIEIAVDGVTLDLNGFTLSGPVNCTGSGTQLTCDPGKGYGITWPSPQSSPRRNLTVRNGTVTGFAQSGVELGEGAVVDMLRVVRVGGNGLFVGANSTVSNSISTRNVGTGVIVAGAGTLIHHITASGNRSLGISAQTGSTAQNVTLIGNAAGFAGGGFIGASTLQSNTYGNFTGYYTSMGNNLCNAGAC